MIVPYWSLYLQWEGFSASQIGELTAIMLASRIIAPNIWGWLADRSGQRMRIVRMASLASVIVFSVIFIRQDYLWIALTLLLFSFFWNASLPQFEVTTLQHLGARSHHYSKVRVWGSLGFIAVVLSLGWLLQRYDPSVIPMALLISALGIWLMSLAVPESEPCPHNQQPVSILTLLKRPSVLTFLSICFLSQASHGAYYTFYTLYLESYGYRPSVIGQLWALGVVAEIGVFMLMHRWLPRFGIRWVLIVSMMLTTVRWLLIAAFPENLSILITAQLLHAASYGSYHAAAIAWVHQHFIGSTQGRGQALYSSASFGAGGALGSLISGYVWTIVSPQWTFFLAAMTSLVAALLAIATLKNTKAATP